MSETIKWRGGQVTRIEALTDAVFGFAITLLFISFEVPNTYEGLMTQLRGLISFAACFALIILVWVYHYKLFTRFDMDDGWTIFLNSLLLFVVLFYVYPLKFVFNAMFGKITGTGVAFTDTQHQLPTMMAIYAIGYTAVFLVFALMFRHAYKRRADLDLKYDDVLYAVNHAGSCLVMCAVGLLAVILAYAVPWQLSGLTGFTYIFIGPAQWVHGTWAAKYWPKRLATQYPATV